jgi:uncharacterized protein YcgI (DUF1989 family)
VILVEVLVPGGFGRAVAAPIGARVTVIDLHGQKAGDFVAVAAPLSDEKLWRGSASGVLAVHVHNRPDASFE